MNPVITLRSLALCCCLLLLAGSFSRCTPKKEEVGYTGEIKEEHAKKLVEICHFIPQDSIKTWVARFQRDTAKGQSPALQAAMNNLVSNATSFNSCIIREIINNRQSIGLRVLYGLSADGRLHVIFVGIKPDYTNLYVKAPEECCGGGKMMDKALNTPTGIDKGGDNGSGGAEYGQIP